MKTTISSLVAIAIFLFVVRELRAEIDADGNGYGDVWEMFHGASSLAPDEDTDADGANNLRESVAGTDPFDPASVLDARSGAHDAGFGLEVTWSEVAGKRYAFLTSPDLSVWTAGTPWTADATGPAGTRFSVGPDATFLRLRVTDTDSDLDGITDAEERWLRFDPARAHTERFGTPDATRIQQGLTGANTVTVAVYDPDTSERWPEPAVFAIRRSGGLQPLTVSIALAGTATASVDYLDPGPSVTLAPGQREAFVEIVPLPDAEDAEGPESVILTLLPGSGYALGAVMSATVEIADTGTGPAPEEAARFLLQAAFGPDQDSEADADVIPENVEEVQSLGFSGWIDAQFARPVGTLQPFVEWCQAHGNANALYGDFKEYAWWNRAMGVPKLRPDAPESQLPDPLRQRVAFALSQILVISDRPEDLAVEPRGMANYYDMLLAHSFGNYRDLLRDVTLHPCMGMYLSHLGNRKPDPANHIFPDENYAREIMQLFSVGLWMLNPDGTRQLDAQAQPIPTYDNDAITAFARVFTGLAFGGTNVNFGLWPRDYTTPMKAWDAEHDCDPKTLLLGTTTPARTPTPGSTGTATMADVEAAIDNLFQHPNTGPFVSTRLIQRFVTSNPNPAYVGRVAAAFADNGTGVRGDLKAVVKAILLDPEARDYSRLADSRFGKAREPFLRCVNFARAFNASAPAGFYALDAFALDHLEEPLKSPSVFNFYLPAYSPPGPITEEGLTAPEFQILNATTMHTGPNYFWNSIVGDLHRWGTGTPAHSVRLHLDPEMALNVPPGTDPDEPVPNVTPLDPDPLIRRLDLALTGGTLAPENHRVIREALQRVGAPTWQWPQQRLRLAIYLIVSSPEFNILR